MSEDTTPYKTNTPEALKAAILSEVRSTIKVNTPMQRAISVSIYRDLRTEDYKIEIDGHPMLHVFGEAFEKMGFEQKGIMYEISSETAEGAAAKLNIPNLECDPKIALEKLEINERFAINR